MRDERPNNERNCCKPRRHGGGKLQAPKSKLQSRDPWRGLMKEETPFGGFHNRLQSYGFQREFLKRIIKFQEPMADGGLPRVAMVGMGGWWQDKSGAVEMFRGD